VADGGENYYIRGLYRNTFAAFYHLCDAAGSEYIPAVPVSGPIDWVGAGDSVMAGMVPALCAGASLREAAIIGNLVASITIQLIMSRSQFDSIWIKSYYHNYYRMQSCLIPTTSSLVHVGRSSPPVVTLSAAKGLALHRRDASLRSA